MNMNARVYPTCLCYLPHWKVSAMLQSTPSVTRSKMPKSLAIWPTRISPKPKDHFGSGQSEHPWPGILLQDFPAGRDPSCRRMQPQHSFVPMLGATDPCQSGVEAPFDASVLRDVLDVGSGAHMCPAFECSLSAGTDGFARVGFKAT